MILRRIIACFIFNQVILFGITAQKDASLKLWYNRPANKWVEALPIGNGSLGAMIYGGPAEEQLQLNEETIWAGEPGNNVPDSLYPVIQQIRKLLFEEKYKEAQEYALKYMPRSPAKNNNYAMPYQTAGNLLIKFPGHESITDYYRDLDIQTAIATVSYKSNGVSYKREIFASFPDKVIIIRLTADKPGMINCSLALNSPFINALISAKQSVLKLSAITGDVANKKGKIKFETLVSPTTEGGTISATDSSLVISNANAVTIYISIATNLKNYKDISAEPGEKANSLLKAVLQKPYTDLKKDHINYYRKYFDRVKFELEGNDQANKPTDIRIAEFTATNDWPLVKLYFQFGRYLLISSSQPGTQPANLQGIWNHSLNPPWGSKYTVNINTEMNYWPAEVTHLSEMHQPLFSMLKDLQQTGKETATKMYHARGFALHHNTDIWRITGVVDGAFYGLWPMGGAWLSQDIWQHYLFTGNKKFLEEYYSVLRDAAMFFVDVLQEDPSKKWLVVAPSMSPENTHQNNVSIAYGTTMDNQLVFDVFANLLQAGQVLNKDKLFRDTVEAMMKRLPPMKIGQYNQLQEWFHDWDNPKDQHRHVSHLYGLYPGNQISPFKTAQLFEAAKQSLLYRGDESTGWSMGWKVNLWARLLDGDHALKLIKDQHH